MWMVQGNSSRSQAEVLQPAFSLVCLVVSNEFREAALLQGGSLAAGPSHAPPSTLPSQICPDVPSLSGAAPGGSTIARLACPRPFSGPSQLNRVSPCHCKRGDPKQDWQLADCGCLATSPMTSVSTGVKKKASMKWLHWQVEVCIDN